MNSTPEPLKSILNDYCHVEWSEEMMELPIDIQQKDWAYDAKLFKDQLRTAIISLNLSLEEYEKTTGEDFDNKEQL